MRIGILGAGGIAKKMADTLRNMDEHVCFAVASRDLEKAKDFAKEYDVEKAYGSYEEMISDENIDLIYVATPHSHHYEHAMLCLRGKKPILVEKAFTGNAKQAREILEYSKKYNIFVAEAIWTRYMPSRRIIQNILNSGIIGEFSSLTANLGSPIDHVPRIREPELAGGALLDLGVYPLNFSSMFFGNDIEKIDATCVKSELGVDLIDGIILTHKNRKVSTIHCNVTAITDSLGMIHGRNGYIIARNINNISKIDVCKRGGEVLESYDIPLQISGYEYQILACAKAISEGKIECEEMPHSEILCIMELMDEIRRINGVKYPFD